MNEIKSDINTARELIQAIEDALESSGKPDAIVRVQVHYRPELRSCKNVDDKHITTPNYPDGSIDEDGRLIIHTY